MHTPAKGSQFGPSNGVSPGTSQQPRPRLDGSKNSNAASQSIAVPKRRIGLIITVLLVDLALAGTGAYMLAEGLSTSSSASTAKPSASQPPDGSAASGSAAPAAKPAAGSGSSAAIDVVPPDAAAEPNAIANVAPPDAAVADIAPADAAIAAVKGTIKKARTKKKTRTQTTQPVDPYDEGPSDPFPPDIPPPPPPPSP